MAQLSLAKVELNLRFNYSQSGIAIQTLWWWWIDQLASIYFKTGSFPSRQEAGYNLYARERRSGN